MRLGIFATDHKPAEAKLVEALKNSPGADISMLTNRELKLVEALGKCSDVEFTQSKINCDLYCIIGVKRAKAMRALNIANKPYIFWDKGYNRQYPLWWRLSYCSHQPTRFLMARDFDSRRAKAQGWLKFKPWREARNGPIVFAGASNKYHNYFDLPDPDLYAADVLRQVRRYSAREFVYRPKPSYHDAQPIAGAEFSNHHAFSPDLERAAVLVTHGSSACLDAMLSGVPSIVLGDGPMRGISSTDLAEIEAPKLASDADRRQVLSALAHFQWRLDEIARGEMWQVIEWARQCQN
jgi:hypothetical protein